MWCRDVTDILERNKNVLEGMKIFEDKCFKVSTFFYETAYVLAWLEFLGNECNDRKCEKTKS